MKKICFFGIYNKSYNRTKVIESGLVENGVSVTHCSVDPKNTPGVGKYLKLIQARRALKNEHFDAVFVAYPGQTVVWLARILFFRTPIIFDAFLSLYDSNVFDRKIYSRFHPRAWKDYTLDFTSVALADKVLLDTEKHIEYFVKTFHARKDKFIRVFIGADESVFYPREPKNKSKKYTIHFHGSFIPLQGVEYIIGAADILKDKDIQFRIIGSGQGFEKAKALVAEKRLEKVIYFEGWKLPEEVADYIAQSDICLGIFGNTDKAQRVIPNKLYECIAMKKPVITADTPAVQEIFRDGEDVLLCAGSSDRALAQAICRLKDDHALALRIASGGFNLFQSRLRPRILVKELVSVISAL